MAARNSNKVATIPAVSYVRMSSSQQEASPDQQRAEITKLADEHGFKIVQEYFDDGVSGDATAKRHQFRQMIHDAGSGKFKAILCWDQDRFSRADPLEVNHYWFVLREAGVKILTVAQGPIDVDDLGGWLTASVAQHGKHQFLRDLSRNTMRGQMAVAQTGAWMSKPPFGYRTKGKGKDRRLVLGPAREVKTVRRIFREYLAGQSLRAIAAQLNAENITGTDGKQWTAGSIRYRLKNRAYAGDTVWNQRSSGKYHRLADGKPTTKNGSNSQNPESEWMTFEGTHEPLVSRQDFDAVQVRLQERAKKTSPVRNGGGYIFTGLLRCSHCGHPMHGSKRGYFCSGYQRHGLTVCRRYTIDQDKLTGLVIDAIEGQFCSPDAIAELRTELHRQAKSETGRDLSRNLRRQLQTVQGKLEKARGRLGTCDDDIFDDVQALVRKFKAEEAELQTSIKAAGKPRKQAIAEADAQVDAAIAGVQRLREALQGADIPQVREFAQRLVERIDLRFEVIPGRHRNSYRLESGTVCLRGGIMSDLSPFSSRAVYALN